jgi:hypothetical protein
MRGPIDFISTSQHPLHQISSRLIKKEEVCTTQISRYYRPLLPSLVLFSLVFFAYTLICRLSSARNKTPISGAMSSCSSENESITEFAEDEAFTEGLEDEAFTGSSEDEAFSESSEDETFSGSSEDEASSGSSEVSQTLCANCLVEPWSQSQLRDLLGECEVEFKYQLSPDQLSSEVDSLCWWCRHLRQYMKREGAIDSVLEGWDITLNSRIPNRIEPKRNSSLLVTISHVDLPTSLSLHFSLGVNVRQCGYYRSKTSTLLLTTSSAQDRIITFVDIRR